MGPNTGPPMPNPGPNFGPTSGPQSGPSGVPTAPPSGPPGLPTSGPPNRGGPSERQRLIWLIGGAAVIVGLVVAGGSIFSRFNGEGTSFRFGWPYLLVGGLLGLAVAGVLVAVARQVGVRLATREIVALGIVCAVIGSLIGLALAPPKKDAEDVSPLTDQEIQRRQEQYGGLNEKSVAGRVDRDGDGIPDVDANGNPIMGLDKDGDGIPDVYLVPCPEGSPELKPPSGGVQIVFRDLPSSAPEDPSTPGDSTPPNRGVIDQNCDGTIDEIVPFSDELFKQLPPGNFGEWGLPDGQDGLPDGSERNGQGEVPPGQDAQPPVPETVPPEQREQRANEASKANFGAILRFVGIGLLIVVALGALAWLILKRDRSESEEPELADETPQGFAPPTPVNENFVRSIDEMVSDPDPRQGILAAYGRLLVGFDATGLGRQPHEGPEEHLDRALKSSAADPAAARELSRWFAIARFSDHPVSEQDRQQAVGALRRVVDSMAADIAARQYALAGSAPGVPTSAPQ